MSVEIVKRDGSRESVKIEKILDAVARACRGVEGVEAFEVAKRTIGSLRPGATTAELDQLSIETAVMLMSKEPNYSKVAARMLAESVKKEVGRDVGFRDYLKIAHEQELLHKGIVDLASTDLERLEYSIRHERDDQFEYFGLKTLVDRYLLRHRGTRLVIERPQWLFMRVALALANSVSEAIEFYEMISTFKFMPATPTLFNAGTMRQQMSSCYLLPVADDSLEGIYKSITDCARLSKFAGGIGITWTKVRSEGAKIKGTNGLSNGIIPFLKVLDSSVHAVNQGGKRKGAAAVYLEPWHADIEAFLELRNNAGSEERRTHNLNLALWVSDIFMRRVEEGGMWSLFCPSEVPELVTSFGEEFEMVYTAAETAGRARKQVDARKLYARMLQTLAETGNGWICFKDPSNRRSAQTKMKENVIFNSNLCTEILEVTSSQETAVCNLGSINLGRFVDATRTEILWDELDETARVATRMLDRVIDRNFYPIPEAGRSNSKWRPIGLGAMGLQDLLFKLRVPFESEKAKAISNQVFENIYYSAVDESSELARKEGAFEAFKESRYVDGDLQVQLAARDGVTPTTTLNWNALAEKVKTVGIRNSLLIAIAPTATIASIAGSFESIEAQTSNIFKRETLSGEFLQVNRYLIDDLKRLNLWNEEIRGQIIAHEGSIQEIEAIPAELRALYKTTWEISQKAIIDMAAERSAFICQSQSLNLFVENPNIGKLSSMYMYAWKKGVKTTYYLRSRSKTNIKKTTVDSNAAAAPRPVPTETEALVCSLENPEACESCQ